MSRWDFEVCSADSCPTEPVTVGRIHVPRLWLLWFRQRPGVGWVWNLWGLRTVNTSACRAHEAVVGAAMKRQLDEEWAKVRR